MVRCLLVLCCAPLLFGQSRDVEKLLMDSEAAWNRGDLTAFSSYYEDSPQTTFIGREVTRGGIKAIEERYRRGYSHREKMGTLKFSEIEVRPLGNGYALAFGRFALTRTAAGGGDASGHFSLVLKKTAQGWKIIHDHSS
jgi:uncharacterized protein (TIGR02246 family)